MTQDPRSLSVRYTCIEVATSQGPSAELPLLYSVTLQPDPDDASFVHGTPLKLGLLDPHGFQAGETLLLTLTPIPPQ